MTQVLIVDDNETNLYMLEVLLRGHGFGVQFAHHGQEALEIAINDRPDLIISDILMPVMDGFALCRAWKKDPQLNEIPFVFYTATYTEPKDMKFGLSLGAEKFLIKPMEPEVLLPTIMEVLEGSSKNVAASSDRQDSIDEQQYLHEYNQALIHKLEKKVAQLQDTNEKLDKELKQRRQAEREQAKLEKRLRQAEKMEALGTLAGGIAHDFNNILTAIMGYTEISLSKTDGNSDLKANLKGVLKAAKRASDMVRQILTFSREQEQELVPVDLNCEVIHVRKMLDRTIPRMITIEQNLAEDLWEIQADRSQMAQVLLNLATNASDAMPEGGKLTIETHNVVLDRDFCAARVGIESGNFIQLKVSDTGHGMAQETMQYIFDPFYTLKESGKGTGLGLAVVFGIIKKIGGYISCTSEPGVGTAFQIYIPASTSRTLNQGVHEAKSLKSLRGRETIFLVDDEPAIRDIGQQILSSQGYQVLTADSGEEALDIYRRQGAGIDLIIMDMSMPGMGGRKCLREIIKINPTAKAIISSGYAQKGQLNETLCEYAQGSIPKPFALAELLKSVRNILDG